MKSKFGKIVIAILFVICMIIPMASNVKAADASSGGYKMKLYEDANEVRQYIDSENDYPTDFEGYLFAGWYKSEQHDAVEDAIVSSGEVPDVGAWALYIPESVLGVKAQLSVNLTDRNADEDAGAIRFVTSIDSLNYKQVGFFFTFDNSGSEIRMSNSMVYDKLFGIRATKVDKDDELVYTPEATFGPDSHYFKTQTFINIPDYQFDIRIDVVPFLQTLDGTIVRGNTGVKTINQGRWLHVSATGSDASGDGTTGKPYATLKHAYEQVIDSGIIYVDSDLEVSETITIRNKQNITIQNNLDGNYTVYRGSALSAASMFVVENGATLTIEGSEDQASLVLDGRTKAEAEVTSTASLISNSGTLRLTNVTAQYVVRTEGNGAVVEAVASTKAVTKVNDAQFNNNEASGAGGVFFLANGNSASTFEDTTFTDNIAGVDNNVGAATILNYSPLTLTDCSFSGNQSAGNGGAIYSGWSTTLTLVGTGYEKAVFDNNGTTGGYGGAVGVGSGKVIIEGYKFIDNRSTAEGGAVYLTTSAEGKSKNVIQGCHFEHNISENNSGGAIHINNANIEELDVRDCLFVKNESAGTGGAINNKSLLLKLTDCVFSDNKSGGNGGAINNQTSTLELKDCKFSINKSASSGGAIYNADHSTLTITGTDSELAVFEGNETTGGFGGAIGFGTGLFSITGYEFSNNIAFTDGGAIYVSSSDGTCELDNVIFTDNESASRGGALGTYGPLNLTDCKFTGNKTTGTKDNNGGAIYSGGSVLVTLIGTNSDMAVFDSNSSAGYGGAYGMGTGKIVIKDYRFTNNSAATNGGAVCVVGSTSYVADTDTKKYSEIENCYFEENSALTNNGGAVYVNGTGWLNMSTCEFYSNHAKNRGGALHDEGGTVYVSNTDFVGNDAGMEGGAFRLAATGTATFENGIFKHNTAKGNIDPNGFVGGGAIKYNSGTLVIKNYIFTGNKVEGSGDGKDIKLNVTLGNSPTLIDCTFDPSGMVDKNGATGKYKDGKGNILGYPVTDMDCLSDAIAEISEGTKEGVIYLVNDLAVSEALTIPAGTNVTIKNLPGETVIVYRDKGLSAASMFTVETGATLAIEGMDDQNSLIFDGRTETEAEANADRDNVTGSTASLVNNEGTLKFANVTVQYVVKTSGFGSVVTTPASAKAVLQVDNAKFINNKAGGEGGVIDINPGNGTSTITNSIFENNASGGNGGAIRNHSHLNITDSKFVDNQANNTANGGGAIYNGSGATLTLTGKSADMAVFDNNETTKGYGGAIGIGSGKIVIDNYKFIRNSASAKAGAVYVTASAASTSTIKNSYFERNIASSDGGAIHTNNEKVTLNITGCKFYNNHTDNQGGALNVYNGGTITVKDSEFKENEAKNGGAIYNAGSNLTLTGTDKNALFQGNTASNWGGAVYTDAGTFSADGYTFDSNKGVYGGAILMFTASEVSNSVFRKNVATSNEGGAIYVNKDSSFIDCIFEGNSAAKNGGAILINGGTITLTGTDEIKAMFTGNTATGLGGAIYLYSGTLKGKGYLFSDNSPGNIDVRSGATNNYPE